MYIYISTLIITLVECASVESDVMHQNILINTPHWYLILFFVAPVIYILGRNLTAIIILNIILITLIVLSGISLAILTANKHIFSLLFPVFQNGITKGFIICIIKTVGLYGCISITFPYLSKIDDKKDEMLRSIKWGLLFLIQMQILSIAHLIMTFGPSIYSMNYPKIIQTRLISIMQFLEFGELYVLFQAVCGWLIKYIITFYGLLIILKTFNLKRKHLTILTYILSVIVYIAAYFASKNSFVLFKLLNYYQYICLINFIIMPFIVFTIYNGKIKAK